MINELIEIENKFQKYLKPKDYTFIGPSEIDLLETFIKNVNMIAPSNIFNSSLHKSLSNKVAVLNALKSLPNNIECRIYVIVASNEQFLIHSTIEEYCDRFKIDYEL